jgi:hypothetical protein
MGSHCCADECTRGWQQSTVRWRPQPSCSKASAAPLPTKAGDVVCWRGFHTRQRMPGCRCKGFKQKEGKEPAVVQATVPCSKDVLLRQHPGRCGRLHCVHSGGHIQVLRRLALMRLLPRSHHCFSTSIPAKHCCHRVIYLPAHKGVQRDRRMVLRRLLRICVADVFRCTTGLAAASLGAPTWHLLQSCRWIGRMHATAVSAIANLELYERCRCGVGRLVIPATAPPSNWHLHWCLSGRVWLHLPRRGAASERLGAHQLPARCNVADPMPGMGIMAASTEWCAYPRHPGP